MEWYRLMLNSDLPQLVVATVGVSLYNKDIRKDRRVSN